MSNQTLNRFRNSAAASWYPHAYTAPEVLFADMSHTDRSDRADIWSMGCILYELPLSKPAFSTDMAVVEFYVRGQAISIDLAGILPEEDSGYLEQKVGDMLQKEPVRRPSASSLCEEFSGYYTHAVQRRDTADKKIYPANTSHAKMIELGHKKLEDDRVVKLRHITTIGRNIWNKIQRKMKGVKGGDVAEETRAVTLEERQLFPGPETSQWRQERNAAATSAKCSTIVRGIVPRLFLSHVLKSEHTSDATSNSPFSGSNTGVIQVGEQNL